MGQGQIGAIETGTNKDAIKNIYEGVCRESIAM